MDREAFVRNKAKELGFIDCRFAVADFLDKEAPLFEDWLKKKHNAKMNWLENHFDLRMDPRKLHPGTKTVISLSFPYQPEQDSLSIHPPKIARYAYGRDYHKVLKKKLKILLSSMNEEFGDINGRAFVDSGPVHERAWAQRSGLGWIGKNSLILSKKAGSYFFLAELLVDLSFTPDLPTTDHCGSCTRCIDACPTDAIVANQVIDSNKCISYLTIELKDALPAEFTEKLNGWAFGCDICQEVCPWNRFSKPHSESDFSPHPGLNRMDKAEWLEITEEVFLERLGNTPLKRAGFDRFKKNLESVLSQ
jgi:epoxyqueuosine reductase